MRIRCAVSAAVKVRALFVACVSGLAGIASGEVTAALLCNADPAIKLEAYVEETRCAEDNKTECLEPTSYTAVRSDGPQVKVSGVMRWQSDNALWSGRQHLLPHFVVSYMRALRRAYAECEAYHDQLFNQIDYVVSQAVHRASPSHAILPALVWENRDGVAQGMEQAELAAFFASAVDAYAAHGAREAAGTMRYAFMAAEALFIPAGVHTGGVVSVVQDECAGKTARMRKCF